MLSQTTSAKMRRERTPGVTAQMMILQRMNGIKLTFNSNRDLLGEKMVVGSVGG